MIAAACRNAQADISARTAAAAEDARSYSQKLTTAAQWYEMRDLSAAKAIEKLVPPTG